MGEGKHNVSYDIADNNTMIPHLSINKCKENSDVEYTSFRNEIIKNIAETEAISTSEREKLSKININKS